MRLHISWEYGLILASHFKLSTCKCYNITSRGLTSLTPCCTWFVFLSCNYTPACATECHKYSCEKGRPCSYEEVIVGYNVGHWLYKITCMMRHCSIAAHAHLLYPVRARDLINRLAKKLVSLYSLSKKLEFVPVASAITAIHSDCLILASYVRWAVIQPPVSRGQIVSADLPLLTGKQTDGQI